MSQEGFVSIYEIDMIILMYVDIRFVECIKRINSYLYRLVEDSWKIRIIQKFPQYISGKPKRESWENYFWTLMNFYRNSNFMKDLIDIDIENQYLRSGKNTVYNKISIDISLILENAFLISNYPKLLKIILEENEQILKLKERKLEMSSQLYAFYPPFNIYTFNNFNRNTNYFRTVTGDKFYKVNLWFTTIANSTLDGHTRQQLKVLDFLLSHKIARPEQYKVDNMARIGKLEILDILSKYGIFPSKISANSAIIRHDIRTLQWLISHEIFPSANILSTIIRKNHLNKEDNDDLLMIEYLFSLNIFIFSSSYCQIPGIEYIDNDEFNTTTITTDDEYFSKILLLPNTNDLNFLAEFNKIKLLKFFISKGLRPTFQAANKAAKNGHLEIIKLLHEINIYPTKDGIYNTIIEGRTEIIQFLSDINYLSEVITLLDNKHNKHIYANAAAQNGHLDILKILSRNNNFPNNFGAIMATKNGHKHIIEWYLTCEYNLKKYINLEVINQATIHDRKDILIFLNQEKNLLPNEFALNEATRKGYFDIIYFIIETSKKQNNLLLPDQEAIDDASENGHLKIVKYLYNYDLIPSPEAVNLTAMNCRLEILQWLAEHNLLLRK